LPGRHNKETQQDRLLAAIVSVSCKHGYEAVTIAQLVSHAGVTRATFYKSFASKEICFVAALERIEHDVLAMTRRSIAERPQQIAAAAAITEIVSFAREHPTKARFLMHEAMAAGRLARAARDHTVTKLARLIEDAYRHVRTDTPVPALPGETLIGALFRLLALRLLHGEPALTTLEADLLDWLAAYECPAEQRRWRTLTPAATPPCSPFLARAPLRAPPALPPGRPRRSALSAAENQRLRILFATAEIVRRDGYAATTVVEITRAAGVDGRVFYKLFSGKQEALAGVRELAFQNSMAVTAGAFFAGGDWPARVWRAGATFTQYLQENPGLTHACIVESHAGSPETAQRLQDLVAGFTIFLQEGYDYQPRRQTVPSTVALEAIAQANLEILYRQALGDSSSAMTELLAHLAYVSLTPFVGTTKASELIAGMPGAEVS
jgi:AcrR family transcriptional regulator